MICTLFDVLAVPERLEERVGEAEEQHVVHRPLAEVVVDAEDVRLVEGAEQDRVQRARRGEVAAERLLDDDARARRCSPRCASCSTTVPNRTGGMAR